MRTTPDRDADPAAESGETDGRRFQSPGGAVTGPPPRRPARSTHGRGNWRSLVISMAILLGVVALWLALLPRPAGTPRPTVDVAASATHVSPQLGVTLYVPVLPEPWRATSVRVTDTAGTRGWHAGFTQDGDERAYLAVEETAATGTTGDNWVAGIVKSATERETLTIDGRSWRLFSDGGDPERRSLVGRVDNTLVVVTGLADLDVLTAAAQSLTAVPTATAGTG